MKKIGKSSRRGEKKKRERKLKTKSLLQRKREGEKNPPFLAI